MVLMSSMLNPYDVCETSITAGMKSEQETNKRSRTNHTWTEVCVFPDPTSAKAAVKDGNCFTYHLKRSTSSGIRHNYSCKTQGCPAKMYLLYKHDSTEVVQYINELAHTHETIKQWGLDNKVKEEIQKMVSMGYKPKQIMSELSEKNIQIMQNQFVNYLGRLRKKKESKNT